MCFTNIVCEDCGELLDELTWGEHACAKAVVAERPLEIVALPLAARKRRARHER
jgi:hypothetical protein